jgi:hypothetical protein
MRIVRIVSACACGCVAALAACGGSDDGAGGVDASASDGTTASDSPLAHDAGAGNDAPRPIDAAADATGDGGGDAAGGERDGATGTDGASDAPSDAGSDAPSDAGSDAPSDGGNRPDGGTACTSDSRCAAGGGGCFVLVPGSAALGTTDFCVAQFEMKAKAGGGVTSAAEGAPLTDVTRANAASACATAASGGNLPTNAQWQTLAQNIELVGQNWSGGAVGSGALNRGHSDATPNVPLAVGNVADPCDQTGNPDCTNGGAADFAQKRTHALSTGSAVWDLAGNVNEWVADDLTPPTYKVDFAGNLSGVDRSLFGPSGAYVMGARPDLSSQYPSNGLVVPGGFAVIEGQNFGSGTIWVRTGGFLLVRGTNFSGALQMEPNSGFLDIGSNILGSGPRVASGNTVIDGTFTPTATQDVSVVQCGGTCPSGTQVFGADGSRGLGFAILYGSGFPNLPFARGGHLGYGPMAGVFTAIPYPSRTFIGYRCVKPAS